jgi:hypothetical protein
LERGGAGWTLHQLRHSDLTHEAEAGVSTPMLLARGASTSRWRPQCLSVTILGSITKIVAYRRSFPQW